jgi:uncharacterized protein YbaA (DUF1428 family)
MAGVGPVVDTGSAERLSGVHGPSTMAGEGSRRRSPWRGDDLNVKGLVPFPRRIKPKPGETVVFSWIVFKSRAHRDRVNAKVMKDPRLAKMMDPKAMPFDVKRMVYGGFKTIVEE